MEDLQAQEMLPNRSRHEERLADSQTFGPMSVPAVSVVRAPKRPSEHPHVDVIDLSAPPRLAEMTSKSGVHAKKQLKVSFPEDDPAEVMDAQDSHITKVLSEIVERDVRNMPVYLPRGLIGQGLPTAPRMTSDLQASVKFGVKKKSLFARQFQRDPSAFGMAREQTSSTVVSRDIVSPHTLHPEPLTQISALAGPTKAGHNVMTDIHRENLDRLAALSHDDIMAERQKLLLTMDASHIAFLKRRSVTAGDRVQRSSSLAEVTPTPTARVTPTPTAEMTPTPTASVTPTPTAEMTPTPTAGVTPTPTAGVTPTPTAVVTPTPTAGVTPTPTAGVTPTPTAGVTPTPTASVTPIPTASVTPIPTASVTPTPTASVTHTPTAGVTPTPTASVTPTPTAEMTPTPTDAIDMTAQFIKSADCVDDPMTPADSSHQIVEADGRPKKVTDQLPIETKPQWLHFNDVEAEKLAWMTDLPHPKSETGHTARFDMAGHVVQANADLPTHLGLHHHGNEPERAGYSLEELFTLAASVNLQQRALALQIISKIIENAQRGLFVYHLQSPLIPTLLDSGLLFLLRWALDDSHDGVFSAAVSSLRHIISTKLEADYIDRSFSWSRGHVTAGLCVEEVSHGGREEDDDEIQQTDADILKHDVIKGLLRMDLLPRLRYILEIAKPSASCVINIIEILTRICQHSLSGAAQVYKCPRLMAVLVKEFLPTYWPPGAENVVYGHPVPHVMRMLRFMCQTGRSITSTLMKEHDLMTIILRYLSVAPEDLELKSSVSYELQIEAYRLWTVLLTYGFSTESIRCMYPVLVTSVRTLLSLPWTADARSRDLVVSLLGLLESAMLCAADGSHVTAGQDSGSTCRPCVTWSEISGLLPLVHSGLRYHTTRLLQNPNPEQYEPPLVLCACMKLLASYYGNVGSQSTTDTALVGQEVQQLTQEVLIPLLESVSFRNTISKIRKCSNILSTHLTRSGEQVSSLLSYNCRVQQTEAATVQQTEAATVQQTEAATVQQIHQSPMETKCDDDDDVVCPVLSDTSPFHLLNCLTDLMLNIGRLNESLIPSLFGRLLCDDVHQYARRLSSGKHSSLVVQCYYTKFELHFACNLVRIASSMHMESINYNHYHLVTIWLLPWLRHGDQHLVMDVVRLIFKTGFLSDVVKAMSMPDVTSLSLDDVDHSGLAAGDCGQTLQQTLLNDIVNNFCSIRQTYEAALTDPASLPKSRSSNCVPYNVQTLMIGRVNQTMVPLDWIFLPIMHAYQRSIESVAEADQPVTIATISQVTDCLRFVYFLETFRREYMSCLSVTTRITRVVCCFLISNDLFMEKSIRAYLSGLLREYTRPIQIHQVNWEEKVQGLVSFYDLFVSLLEHYDSVSFGDALFSSYLLLPLQQRYDSKYRRAIWTEYPNVLRALHLPIDKLPVPLENFMLPEENDRDLILLYCRNLCSSCVRHQWSPLMYAVAVHHVNRFIYSNPRTDPHTHCLRTLLNAKDETMRHHVLYYNQYSDRTALGFNLYEQMPARRQSRLDDVIGTT